MRHTKPQMPSSSENQSVEVVPSRGLTVKKVLELHSSHLPPWLSRDIALNMIALPSSCKQDECGFILGVLAPDDFDNRYPEEIRPHLRLARENGCHFINYDHYGPLVEGLGYWEEDR